MAGFVGKVLATATGIAVYELAVRPLVASRLMGSKGELSGEDELAQELDDADAELERAERELNEQDTAFLEDD